MLDFASHQVRDHFAVGFAQEFAAVGDQLVAQRLEILDDAVVDQRHRPGDVRMGIVDRRRAMCRPARMRNPGVAVQLVRGELAREIVELALGTAALELAVLHGADAGRVIAAIFERFRPSNRRCATASRPTIPTIPHMLLLVLLRLLARPKAGGPAGKSLLLAARDGQLVRRDILGHHRTSADDRAGADADRCNQRAVGADEGARADLRPILAETVVIAGDGAGADIGFLADRRVADVA